MGVSIREGVLRVIGSGQNDFQVAATRDMISPLAKWLPDLDLAFNTNDEPRVLIPHEDVSIMVTMADAAMYSVSGQYTEFSRASDLGNGEVYHQVSETLFNHLDHQQTWSHSRMPCAPETPARNLDSDVPDAEMMFSYGGIKFVDNIRAFSDLCLSPSVREVIGLFHHPNVFAVSHDLVPVFSPSKLSSFLDILYPSPYYYADKTENDENAAMKWDDKIPKMYWRGATSGGFSQGGTWRTLLRQSILL